MREPTTRRLWSYLSSTRPFLTRRCSPSRLIARRWVQISATPSSTSPVAETLSTGDAPLPDARFEVLGAPYSLLSVSLSASQTLYTRRGTLVGVSGKPNNIVSSLSILEPFRRSLLGIPFLYQRVHSTTPLTALVSTRSPITSFTVVHLDGRLDWIVAQPSGLLAWTGASLSVRPKINTKMSLSHWGNSYITGRGVLALAGKGQIYQVQLKADEDYVIHPSNVLAYTVSSTPPLPFRFASTSFKLQVPSLPASLNPAKIKFVRVMSETPTWRTIVNFFHRLRILSRRTIWGDRLFLQFKGPATILVSSRASRLSDVLTTRDVEEIADAPAGALADAIKRDMKASQEGGNLPSTASGPAGVSGVPLARHANEPRISYATVRKGQGVSFEQQRT